MYFTVSASTNYCSNYSISNTALSFTIELYGFDRTGKVVIASLIASDIFFITKALIGVDGDGLVDWSELI